MSGCNAQYGLCQAFTAEALKKETILWIGSARIETEKVEL